MNFKGNNLGLYQCGCNQKQLYKLSSKIKAIQQNIASHSSNITTKYAEVYQCVFTESPLSEFQPTTEEEVEWDLLSALSMFCEFDLLPTWLLKQSSNQLISLTTEISNRSVATIEVPARFKKAVVCPPLKKPDLEAQVLKNYHLVSKLSYLSKLLERIVSAGTNTNLAANNLHDSHQSAYRKHH